jgi:hypothetical protein
MDRNTELLLQKIARAQNWEDEEKASYDLETLRQEFQKRLHEKVPMTPLGSEQNGVASKMSD